jgi:hypothetical protein
VIGVYITNFMGYNLTIIIMRNLIFIRSYGINMDVVCLFMLSAHESYAHNFHV